MFRAVLVMVAIAGCDVGEVSIGGTPDGGGSGAATFQSMIAPLVTECVACHRVQIPVLSSFQSLGARYKTKPGSANILVTKGSTGNPPGTHQGIPYLTPAEQMTVAAWIDSL